MQCQQYQEEETKQEPSRRTIIIIIIGYLINIMMLSFSIFLPCRLLLIIRQLIFISRYYSTSLFICGCRTKLNYLRKSIFCIFLLKIMLSLALLVRLLCSVSCSYVSVCFVANRRKEKSAYQGECREPHYACEFKQINYVVRKTK